MSVEPPSTRKCQFHLSLSTEIPQWFLAPSTKTNTNSSPKSKYPQHKIDLILSSRSSQSAWSTTSRTSPSTCSTWRKMITMIPSTNRGWPRSCLTKYFPIMSRFRRLTLGARLISIIIRYLKICSLTVWWSLKVSRCLSYRYRILISLAPTGGCRGPRWRYRRRLISWRICRIEGMIWWTRECCIPARLMLIPLSCKRLELNKTLRVSLRSVAKLRDPNLRRGISLPIQKIRSWFLSSKTQEI